MSLPQLCADEFCYMPAILLMGDLAFCVADYKVRNGGRI